MALINRLKNGREIEVDTNNCNECNGEWWTLSHEDWISRFCPYCGIEFIRRTVDNKPV